MRGIQHRSFGSLLKKVIDNRGRTCPTAKDGLPLIATNCIKNEQLYPVFENIRYVDQETYQNWFRGHPEPGDMLFVLKGTPGRVAWVPDPVGFCIAQDMVAIRVDEKKIHSKYLFAVLRSSQIQQEIEGLHVGSLIPHFKKGDFDDLQIPCVEEKLQKYIGDTYFSLSEKIDLLHRQNATLEAMAEALFRQWFPLDLEPLPSGWKRTHLKDCTTLVSRGITPKYNDFGEGIPILNQKCIRNNAVDFSLARTHNPIKKVVFEKFLQFGDILVNSTGVGTLGRAAQVFHLKLETLVDSHITIVRPSADILCHYLGINILMRQQEVELLGEGSTGQTELSRERLGQLEVIIPPKKILDKFDAIVSPMRQRATANQAQICTLENLRDTLLPKLMSGEVRVEF